MHKKLCREKKGFIAKLQFEQAQKLQEEVFLLERMKKEYQLLREAFNYSNTVLIFQEKEMTMVLTLFHSRLQERLKVNNLSQLTDHLTEIAKKYNESSSFLFPKLLSPFVKHKALKKEELDEMIIIANWIKNHKNQCLTLPINDINTFFSYMKSKNIKSLTKLFSLHPTFLTSKQ